MSSSNHEYVTQLTNKGVIQLRGDERVKYLQGQITADVTKLSQEQALLACHCDFKGKVWSVFYMLDWQDSILLLPHHSVLEKSLSELNKYGVFAKVDIDDQTNNWNIIAGCGVEFEQHISNVLDALPSKNMSTIANEHGLALCVDKLAKRYLVLQPKDAAHSIEINASDSAELWEIDEIKSGLADVRAQSSNEFVPQMLNLQTLGAIDFEKGCYMGQEVIARTKYLGRNKKAAFMLQSSTANTQVEGELLEYQIDGNWRHDGKILRSATNNDLTWALAVLSNDTETRAEFRLKSNTNVLFTVQALPYALT
ncbi:tRNA-modifying protein YgfZ [Paraglaciecola aquimarina]|uniref:tRNA-modifying protein YgfZ n=1 Tax=Paraglaciecola aquimarina TaxID=1235557 RepID=A0ABU3SWL3_9ALTE|nr:tRNA-modifying protein YgfZ [Paraglaciecola aquimarina]MDU0354377.1 tRNA-modifying protein YgfZ [Paraglaciecola aquimarina]